MPLFAVGLTGLLLAGMVGRAQPLQPDCGTVSETTCERRLPIPVAAPSAWKFTRTQGSKEGGSFAAIMKTADTAQSDPDFAGLIVRCAPKGKIDVLVALIRPFPPRSHPQVTIAAGPGGGTQTFEASMAAAGAAVLLPDEVGAFAGSNGKLRLPCQ